MYQKMKMPKMKKGKVILPQKKEINEDLRKEAAIQRMNERKAKDKRAQKALRNQPKLTAAELFKFQTASELYQEKMNAFRAGKKTTVSGKGDKRVVKTVVQKGHAAEPSFKALYKQVLKTALV